MSKHRVIIVGGGFAGIRTAYELANDERFKVILISDHADFRFYPALFRTATGGKRRISSIPLVELFHERPVEVILDRVLELDKAKKTVISEAKHKYNYDSLVLALGVKTNYFNIKGLSDYSYGIKTVADAERLKAHLHRQLIEEKHPDLNYVVVGGGPTGVELAGALPSYLKAVCRRHGINHPNIHVDLVEAAPRLLPRAPKDLSRRVARHLRSINVRLYLGTAVQAETADALMINNKRLMSHTVIWTAGVANHPFYNDQGFQLARNGKVRVDQFLQSDPDVFVIGDNADTPFSGMAQTALLDGKFVAQNLMRRADQQDFKPYSAKRPVYVFPAGPYWAAVLWGSWRFYGVFGYLMRRAADWIAYHDYEAFYQATERWMEEDDNEETCPMCKRL
ncbi:MAG TPA: FAD-dependent oxidoreductase [Candidatus Saccharimonadales bacterium]|nr:FAD-dependent oxidoreductase [Candidatus Saccharimonadales bacterium]